MTPKKTKTRHRLFCSNRQFPSASLVVTLACLVLASCAFRTDPLDEIYHKVESTADETTNKDIYANYAPVQDRHPHVQDPNLVMVVALSGGGLRAANFSLGAMLALDYVQYGQSDLLRQVDYFTSVSGGGLAAGAYLSAILANDCDQRADFRLLDFLGNDDGKGQEFLENLRAGFLADGTLFKSLNPAVMLTHRDRGDVLQSTFARRFFQHDKKIAPCGTQVVNHTNEVKLGHIFVPRGHGSAPTTPYLIANATNYKNGEIVSFTPRHIEDTGITCFTHHLKKQPLGAGYYYELPLAVGIRSSANFPAGLTTASFDIAPQEALTKNQPCRVIGSRSTKWNHIHLTDGGEADNLGVNEALKIMNYENLRPARAAPVDTAQTASQRPRNKKTFLLVIVDAFIGETHGSSDREHSHFPWEEFSNATNLPLSSFRLLTNAALSPDQDEGKSFSSVDAISRTADINVAYVGMDNLNNPYRNVGTILPTALGLTRDQQSRLLAAGAYQTFAALGVTNPDDEAKRLLTRVMPGTTHSISRPFVAGDAEVNHIIRFSKFQKHRARTEAIDDSLTALKNLDDATVLVADQIRTYLISEAIIQARDERNQCDIKARADNKLDDIETGEPIDLPVSKAHLNELESIVKVGRKRLERMVEDLEKFLDKNEAPDSRLDNWTCETLGRPAQQVDNASEAEEAGDTGKDNDSDSSTDNTSNAIRLARDSTLARLSVYCEALEELHEYLEDSTPADIHLKAPATGQPIPKIEKLIVALDRKNTLSEYVLVKHDIRDHRGSLAEKERNLLVAYAERISYGDALDDAREDYSKQRQEHLEKQLSKRVEYVARLQDYERQLANCISGVNGRLEKFVDAVDEEEEVQEFFRRRDTYALSSKTLRSLFPLPADRDDYDRECKSIRDDAKQLAKIQNWLPQASIYTRFRHAKSKDDNRSDIMACRIESDLCTALDDRLSEFRGALDDAKGELQEQYDDWPDIFSRDSITVSELEAGAFGQADSACPAIETAAAKR